MKDTDTYCCSHLETDSNSMKSQFAYVRIYLYLECNKDINFSRLSSLKKLHFSSKIQKLN